MDGFFIRQPDGDILVRLIEGKSYVYDAESESWVADGDYISVWRNGDWKKAAPEEAQSRARDLLRVQKMKMHEAISFAAAAHQGQLRKGSGSPYIVHPFEAAQILTEEGCAPHVVMAGLLHDVLEDTTFTAGEILQRFGPKVLKLVLAVTEDKDLTWEERKRETINFIRLEAPLEAMLVCCADKLSNLRSMKADYEQAGDFLWARFKRGKNAQRWYYEEMLDALRPLEDYKMYVELKERFLQVFES